MLTDYLRGAAAVYAEHALAYADEAADFAAKTGQLAADADGQTYGPEIRAAASSANASATAAYHAARVASDAAREGDMTTTHSAEGVVADCMRTARSTHSLAEGIIAAQRNSHAGKAATAPAT